LLKINPTDPSGAPGATADAFATVFVVATIMVAAVLVPAFFLPRTKLTAPVDPAVLVGH
ncbi:MAG: drug resistance transporter, EmrB/QacA subfamily, partial [Nocardioides sp.]|nr:drug resistance transporter, EmrB/QacA subfamily [Nocardioides sp.]